MKHLLILIFFISPLHLFSQANSTVLHLNDYYELVRQAHPVAKQAILIRSRGDAAVSQARGAFDPKLVSSYDAKQFENSNYYDIWDSYLKIPTLLNVDLKAGFERNSGRFLNPERNVPGNGLYYAGVSLPLGEGLFVNPRNIDLKKGKLTQLELQIQSEMILNNLFLDSNYAFWHWYEMSRKLELVSSNLQLINERFEGIRQGVLNGENAAIDSIETLIQVQQWTILYRKATNNYQNSMLLLNNFIWNQPIDLTNVTPGNRLDNVLSELGFYLDFAVVNHPVIQNLSVNGAKLDLDRRLNREQIKPIIDLNYNVLLSENNSLENAPFLANNYKAGVNFSFPLLVRKERAKLKTTNLKRQENDLKLNQKRREISNKVEQSYNKISTFREMITQQRLMVDNYQRMLDGEQIKFNNGESSIFLINSRENKRLDADLKLIELDVALGRAIAELKWASGILVEEISNLNNSL